MNTGNSKRILNDNSNKKTTIGKPILINTDDENIYLTINKQFLKNNNNFDIHQTLMLATSPFFTNENKSLIQSKAPQLKKQKQTDKLFPHIAFFIENKNHYTGGRYSLWHQAVLLSSVTTVTIVTNLIPKFRNDFKVYETNKLNIIVSDNYNLDDSSTDYDIIVGTPLLSGEYATRYAKKFDLPLYLQLFESPNWVVKFRDGTPDATEEFWSSYKKCLKEADVIMVPSFESRKWLMDWDEIFKEIPIEVIYPCINQWAADYVRINCLSKIKDKINIVMSSRMTGFKSPLSIIKKLDKNIYKIHLIGKIWDVTLNSLESMKKKGYDIIIHGAVNDAEKFEIINECDILIHPSSFEGFGMPPLEGLYMNKYVIAYDLPVLKEIYGDSIVYAKLNDANDFVNKIKEYKCDKTKLLVNDKVNELASVHNNLGKLMTVLNIPKVTAGMIVYNGDDYMEYAISSIYDHLYQLIIVEGAVEKYSDNYRSSDRTMEIIKDYESKDFVGKIKLITKDRLWKDKIEMQNKIASNVKGDIYLKLDHDEVWDIETFKLAINEFYIDHNLTILRMPYYHFWLNFNTVAKDAGGKWSTCHPRMWRWNKDFKHTISFNHFRDINNNPVSEPIYKSKDFKGGRIYHFGYVRELGKLQNKINYYANRGIEKFVTDTVTNYKDGNLTQPTQKVDSWAEPFKGKLPELLKAHKYYNCKDIREVGNG